MQAAFIGLGAMGAPMARQLAGAGLLAGVWNRSADKATALAAELETVHAAQPADLWQLAEVVVLCVRADADVLAVVDALAVPAARGRLVVDCSTIADHSAQAARDRLQAVGARYIDAPVTGGTEGARNGTLSFMVGGATEDVVAAQPLFDAMGARAVHLGPVGAGQRCKAVNQVMAAGINQAVCEGMALAAASGLDTAQVVAVVGSGAAGSWFVNHRGRSMVAGDYPPGFRVDLHLKDLRACQRMAAAAGVALPASDRVAAEYEALVASGHGAEDISALYRRQAAPAPGTGSAGAPWWFEEGCWIEELHNRDDDPEVSVARVRLPARSRTRLHRLHGVVERYLILAGEGTATVDGSRYPLGPGASLHIPAGASQCIVNDGDEELCFLAVCTPRFRRAIYEDCQPAEEPPTGGQAAGGHKATD